MTDDDLERAFEAEFARLGIGSTPVELTAVVGEPPWLYPPEHILAVARTLPAGAGAQALGAALIASLTRPRAG